MISAYTLVRVETRKNVGVFNTIRKLPAVKEVTPVYGEYDLLVKSETKTLEELDSFIYNSLRTISGIKMTTTMIVAKIEKKK